MPAPYQFGWVHRSGSWGDAASTVTNFAPCKRETMSVAFAKVEAQAPSQTSAHRHRQGSKAVKGSYFFDLDPDYTVPLLRYALGSYTAGPPQKFEMADTLPWFGCEIDKGVQRFRYPDNIVNRAILRIRRDEAPELELECFAFDQQRTGTAFPSLTSTNQQRFDYQDATLLVADKANTMVSGDEVDFQDLELTIENNLDEVFGSADQRIVLPERSNFRMASLRFGLTRYNSSQWATWKDDQEELQAQLQLVRGSEILTGFVSTAFVDEGADAPVDGPRPIQDSINLTIRSGTNSFLSGIVSDDMVSFNKV